MAYKVSMVSLGCPKNQVDAEQMLYTLQNAGFELTPVEAEADAIIINTCGFIESAKAEASGPHRRSWGKLWEHRRCGRDAKAHNQLGQR